jgi:hypothetical protein
MVHLILWNIVVNVLFIIEFIRLSLAERHPNSKLLPLFAILTLFIILKLALSKYLLTIECVIHHDHLEANSAELHRVANS